MPRIAEADFDKSILPGTLKKETAELIELAVMLGWTVHKARNQTVSIAAPGDPSPKRHHFGVSGRQIGSSNRLKRDILKYGDPDKVRLMNAITEGRAPDVAMISLPNIHDPGVVIEEPEPQEVEPVSTPATETIGGVVIPDAHIVSTKPMLARRGKGQGYESDTTFERKWSDGTTDYACRYDECEYTNVDRLAVSRHYANIHSKGRSETPPSFKADLGPSTYAPRKSRVEALAQALADAHAGGALDFEAIAREALTWVNDQSRSGTEYATEREEMTPEDTLQRIRTLLDRGEYIGMQQRQTELEERLIAVQHDLEVARAEAALNAAKAEQARTSLRTFLDLGRDLVGDDEEEQK